MSTCFQFQQNLHFNFKLVQIYVYKVGVALVKAMYVVWDVYIEPL